MNKIAAIFDVDKTLVKVPTEQVFFRYLTRHRQLAWSRALAFLSCLLLRPRHRFHNKSYLGGQPVQEIEALARGCYRDIIAPHVSPQGRQCIHWHQEQGHKIVLLTGSLSCLIQPLFEELAADWLIATRLVIVDNKFTGEINGLHPRGANKRRLVLELAHYQTIDLSQSYAYADHLQDLPLLQSIGHPVVVNPSLRLKMVAQHHQWPIRYF